MLLRPGQLTLDELQAIHAGGHRLHIDPQALPGIEASAALVKAAADGDAPVRTFIAAMPGWKREVGRTLDELIVEHVPGVKKAVRWNTPFYGVEGRGWFLGFHCITKYVKVAFFNGASLEPMPPVESKKADVRYYHIHEGEEIDRQQLVSWIKQAAKLPGMEWF